MTKKENLLYKGRRLNNYITKNKKPLNQILLFKGFEKVSQQLVENNKNLNNKQKLLKKENLLNKENRLKS